MLLWETRLIDDTSIRTPESCHILDQVAPAPQELLFHDMRCSWAMKLLAWGLSSKDSSSLLDNSWHIGNARPTSDSKSHGAVNPMCSHIHMPPEPRHTSQQSHTNHTTCKSLESSSRLLLATHPSTDRYSSVPPASTASKKTMDINTKQSREPLRGQRACAISASPFLPATDTQTPWKIHCTGAEGIECLRLAPTKAEACSFPNIGLIRKKLDTIRTPNFSAHQEKNP